MVRKQVVVYSESYENRGPRIGQKIRTYYRIVTQLAKDLISKDIKEAYQIIGYSFEEYTYNKISNMINNELKKLNNNSLYVYDNYVIAIYHNNDIIKYYDYNDTEILDKFDIPNKVFK